MFIPPMTSVTDYLAVAFVLGLLIAVRAGWAIWRARRSTRPIARAPIPGAPRPIAPTPRVVWWQRPRVRQLALGAALLGTFLCWWIAAAEDVNELMSRGQWRLVGWACLAAAVALFLQSRPHHDQPPLR